MSNMLNSALNLMGFLWDEEEEDEEDGSEVNTARKNQHKIVSLIPKASQPTIVQMAPVEFDEVKEISKRLQDNNIVTLNLALVDVALRNRIFDFACGTVYALDGGVMKLADHVYIFAREGVTLKERPKDSSKFQWR